MIENIMGIISAIITIRHEEDERKVSAKSEIDNIIEKYNLSRSLMYDIIEDTWAIDTEDLSPSIVSSMIEAIKKENVVLWLKKDVADINIDNVEDEIIRLNGTSIMQDFWWDRVLAWLPEEE